MLPSILSTPTAAHSSYSAHTFITETANDVKSYLFRLVIHFGDACTITVPFTPIAVDYSLWSYSTRNATVELGSVEVHSRFA